MKYLIVGAGAMGCVLAAHMTRAGLDVTVIARGEALHQIRADGLKIWTPDLGDIVVKLKVAAESEYVDRPDVVILSIKAYAFDTIVPLLNRICDEHTIVLPLLNALCIGDTIASQLTAKPTVLEGVAYVACERVEPNKVRQKLDFFDIVFGMRVGHDAIPELELIKADLIASSAGAVIEANMLQAALRKFVRVSAGSAALIYYDCTVGGVVSDPERMKYFEALCQEIVDVAQAAGCPFPPEDDVMKWAVDSAKEVFPEYRTSMKYDYDAGRPLEWQTQFGDVLDLGRKFGLAMPAYQKIVDKCISERLGEAR